MASFDESTITGEAAGHGLVHTIRSSLASEEFDLAGYTESRTKDLMASAFAEPFTNLDEMIKFTFIVGGGKHVRSRYAEDLPKWTTACLREIGFTEDRSAALDFSSQGTYKQQHDTGQNLKTIIVFPKVTRKESEKQVEETTSSKQLNSPEKLIMQADFVTFSEMVKSKTQSWSQRKAIQKVLQEGIEAYNFLEAKLMRGEMLNPSELELYESNSGCDIEKLSWLQQEIKKMVDTVLTATEKTEVIETMKKNQTLVEAEIEQLKGTENLNQTIVNRIEKLKEKLAAIVQRRTTLEGQPPVLHRLKHREEIQKLVVKQQHLAELDERRRIHGNLTITDLKELEQKAAIDHQIIQYSNASRCWFEGDESFAIRMKIEVDEGVKKYQQQKKTINKSQGKKTNTHGTTSSSGWATVGQTKKGSGLRTTTTQSQAKGGFAAAFGDDEDDD